MKLLLILALLALPACKGPQGTHGIHGINGVDGQPGAQGPAGADGQDGAVGPAGQNAPPTPYTPIGLENPCGDAPSVADEIFIRMANGDLIASYGTGNSVRFAVLTPGNYVTTDGDNCTFTIAADGSIINESH